MRFCVRRGVFYRTAVASDIGGFIAELLSELPSTGGNSILFTYNSCLLFLGLKIYVDFGSTLPYYVNSTRKFLLP